MKLVDLRIMLQKFILLGIIDFLMFKINVILYTTLLDIKRYVRLVMIHRIRIKKTYSLCYYSIL